MALVRITDYDNVTMLINTDYIRSVVVGRRSWNSPFVLSITWKHASIQELLVEERKLEETLEKLVGGKERTDAESETPDAPRGA